MITIAGEQLVGLSQDSCEDLSKKMKQLKHTNHALIQCFCFWWRMLKRLFSKFLFIKRNIFSSRVLNLFYSVYASTAL